MSYERRIFKELELIRAAIESHIRHAVERGAAAMRADCQGDKAPSGGTSSRIREVEDWITRRKAAMKARCSTVDTEETAEERFFRVRSAVIEQIKDVDSSEAVKILISAINELYAPRGFSVGTTLGDSIFLADAR